VHLLAYPYYPSLIQEVPRIHELADGRFPKFLFLLGVACRALSKKELRIA